MTINKVVKGNAAKYLSYKLAHSRMKNAIESGFPLEAIAIAESLMTDRLLSYVNHPKATLDRNKTLGAVARKAVELCKKNQDDNGEKHAKEALAWTKKRNEVLHGIAKSGQGQGPHIAAEEFLDYAKRVAGEGACLVRDIQAWHRPLVRQGRS